MRNIIFRIALAAIYTFVLVACSQEEFETTDKQNSNTAFVQFNIYDEGNLQAGGSGAAKAPRKTATNGTTMVTTFELGDQAGLYIVTNNSVIYDNVKLTYNANGFWEAAAAIEATTELANAKFYAYYPYRADVEFDVTAAEPFANMVSASTPSNLQNSKSNYESADIMVTGPATIDSYNTVSLPLKHKKAMVCVELPNSSYIFENSGMSPYVVAKAENASFTLNGTAVLPYFDESSQSYRLIIEPQQESILSVSFSNNGESKSFEASNLSAIREGQYAKYVIDGGASLVTMTLQVGDYYCSDGKIVCKDTPVNELPKNVIGVVFKIGTTDAISTANPSWTHGIVIGLQDIRAKWGTNASTTSDQNAAGWRYWYESYGLSDQNRKTNAAQLDESIMAEEGFEVTKSWRAVPEPLTIGGYTLDYTSVMNETLNSWIEANPLPSKICSGWYIPSLVDWRNIEAQNNLLSAQLEAVGGKSLQWSSYNYWSCNVRAAGSNWCYVGNKTTVADRYKGMGCNSSANYRFLFAF